MINNSKNHLLDLFYTSIVNHRKNPINKIIAKIFLKFNDAYEGFLLKNPETNGEKYVLKAIANQLKFTDTITIMDVGANIGEWTSMASSILPSAKIHSFEIVDSTAELMRRNIGSNPNVIINNCGLADKCGLMEVLYFPLSSVATTLVVSAKSLDLPNQRINEIKQVEVITGDSYVKNNNINKINFLKIDVEGAEKLVLFGFSETLSLNKIDIIQFEYVGSFAIHVKFLLKDFYDFLEKYDYVIGKIYPNYVNFKKYSYQDEMQKYSNYLAVHKSQVDLINLLS